MNQGRDGALRRPCPFNCAKYSACKAGADIAARCPYQVGFIGNRHCESQMINFHWKFEIENWQLGIAEEGHQLPLCALGASARSTPNATGRT